MSEVKWIKIATDIFDDEKILLIESMPDADALIVIWLKLLVLAGKCNNSGVLLMSDVIPYTEEMLASIFRRPLNTIRLALTTFERFGMVEVVNDVITIPNWEKHQSLDQLEKRREYMKKYMREKRQKQKQLTVNNCKVNVSGADKELDIDKEIGSSKLVNRLSEEEADIIFSRYVDADILIDEVQAEVDRKNKTVKKPFEYIVGYATNKAWQEN